MAIENERDREKATALYSEEHCLWHYASAKAQTDNTFWRIYGMFNFWRTCIGRGFQDKYTSILFKDSTETKDIEQSGIYYPTYIPKGFKETATEKFGNTVMLVYANEAGEEILFDQNPGGTGKTSVDNENTIYREIEISGNEAYLFEGMREEDASVLIWESGGVVFKLISSSVDSADLIRMGESILK